MEQSISPLRWTLKKTARMGTVLGSLVTGQVGFGHTSSPASRIRVLTYHRFGPSCRDPFCVSREAFEAQMAWLAEHKLAISLTDLERFLKGQQALPNGAALVTIDDGYRSIYTEALPILKKYNIPAVVFLTVGAIQDEAQPFDPASPEPEPHLTWQEVRELEAAGITIASHGWTHRSIGKLSPEEATEEAVRSHTQLQAQLGHPVSAFAYPFGTLADFNDDTAKLLHTAGYQYVFTSQHGAVQQQVDPLVIPRVKVESGEPLWQFQLLVRGGLDAWQLVDQTLWKLQQTPSGTLSSTS
ncbi:polysaccharide deacetylase family protein [Leptolyngbya sp. AN02str]|uniref:polysaccharide deacetylase family protein n=1 Tax=Leptolyngbya sp. AN02str TaxID=3423363 RepID=UPI003D3103F7